ncbi:MAG: hypothetical protein OEV44_05730 [Spirochaetota bacterium]|nr:hypothetical protein [Spirochaetota bacterium]
MKKLIVGLSLCLLPNIFIIACTKEIIEFSTIDVQVPRIPNLNHKYSLILRETNKKVGSAKFSVRHYKTENRLFYQMSYDLTINWINKETGKNQKLNITSNSVIDSQFKLYSFESKLLNNTDELTRRGFYKTPHFYIVENDKNSRIYAPKGIFSNLVEHFIIRSELKEPGNAVSYHFLNVVSLNVEEERISFEKKEIIKIHEKEIPVKALIVNNYTNGYYSTYWVSNDNKLVQKTDFREAIIWRLDP